METNTTTHAHKKITNYAEQVQKMLPGNSYKMINIGKKITSSRTALAQGRIFIGKEAFTHIQNKTMPKGDPLILSEIAGINGAKCAYQFIPLCHPLNLDHVTVHTILNEEDYSITVYCLASANAKTGVEMEALAGVNASLLAIYDLCKNVNPDLSISDIRLLFKVGGKSGVWTHPHGIPEQFRTVITPQKPLAEVQAVVFEMSDRAYQGTPNYPDVGIYLKDELEKLGADVLHYELLPDEKEYIKQRIKQIVAEQSPDLLMLHGGTGLSPRDVTPAAVLEVADRTIPGIGELLRKNGENYTPYAWLSSSVAAILQSTLIIVIPGCKEAIYESLDVLPQLIVKSIHELRQFRKTV
jgi:cyclic pyranopterin phosphate synthase